MSLFNPLLAVTLLISASAIGAESDWKAYADGPGLTLLEGDGTKAIEIRPSIWGPGWKSTGVKGELKMLGSGSTGVFSGTMGGTQVPFSLTASFDQSAPSTLTASYQLQADASTDLTLAAVSFVLGKRFEGGEAEVVDGGERKRIKLPAGRGGFGKAVSSIRLSDGEGLAFDLTIKPAMVVESDNEGRIVLAKGSLAADARPSVTLSLTLPSAVRWYAVPDALPDPPDWEKWFTWTGKGNIAADSVLNASEWLEKPAGKHGRIVSKADQLVYDGKPIKLWGINVCYASTAPPKDLAEKQARLYASLGINTVRFHKYADGAGWAGILNGESFTEFDPEKLDLLDYFFAKLKENGIYVKFSPTFGTFKLGPKDRESVPFFDELGEGRRGAVTTPHGAAYLSDELRDLQIKQMLNLLEHRNPYTGLTYAEDPAVVVVELLNEQSILFHGTMGAMKTSPTLRKRTAERFTDWLLDRYGSKEAVLAAWGAGALNAFAGEGFDKESFEEKSIVPAGNPWFYDPTQLEGSQAKIKVRLLDTMRFLYELQNAFYENYITALKKAGYTGEIVASNWQAGRAFSHYYNLHSDALAGIVDRHNYFSGAPPMLDQPGGGSMSAGMQQVADRPFMLSEWVHVFPTPYAFEGPAILGAYGMGLQGWDVSYLFQNRDPGGYLPKLGTDRWVFAQPEVMGIFPAVSRQVLRGDVKESEVVVKRSVHVPSLHEGKLGFDDQVKQGYDEKTFDSTTVPAMAMAAIRSVISFDDAFQVTEPFDLSPYIEGNAIASSTGQLRWSKGSEPHNGWFTMDTPGTKAVVGFAPEQTFELGEVSIIPRTKGAAIYVTASGRDSQVADAERLLLVTMARTRNEGMKYLDHILLNPGKAPIKMEPVKAKIQLKRDGRPVVHVLDHDGKRTDEVVEVAEDGSFEVDGAVTRAVYYEILFSKPGL